MYVWTDISGTKARIDLQADKAVTKVRGFLLSFAAVNEVSGFRGKFLWLVVFDSLKRELLSHIIVRYVFEINSLPVYSVE